MKPPDITTPEGRAQALELEKNVFRIRRQAREDVEREPRTKPPTLIGHSFEELLRHKFPHRPTVIARGEHAVIRASNIVQVFAYRGVGKTWLFETLALIAAYQVEALGLRAPKASRVLYVDGEMGSEDVQERFRKLADWLAVPRQLGLLDPAERQRLVIVGADWQQEYLPRLDTAEGQAAIEPFVEPAEVILLDNRSSLLDPEGEKDPTAWQPAQDWLLSLRRRGKAVLMAHHANRQGGARGIGKAEDVIDLNLKLSRPEGYTADEGARFLVEFDKARGVHGPAAAAFIATLGSNGWSVDRPEDQDAVESRAADDQLDLAILEVLQRRQDITGKDQLALRVGRKAPDVREALGRLMSGATPLVDQERRGKPFVLTSAGAARLVRPSSEVPL